jgi:hypothetical protein
MDLNIVMIRNWKRDLCLSEIRRIKKYSSYFYAKIKCIEICVEQYYGQICYLLILCEDAHLCRMPRVEERFVYQGR